MDRRDLDALLERVASGEVDVEAAASKIDAAPLEDLGYAMVDHQRGLRQGVSEVIYGEGKSADQIAGIVASMLGAGQERILITRIEQAKAQEVSELLADGLSLADDDSDAGQGGDDAKGACTGSGAWELLPVFTYYDAPRLATLGEPPAPDGRGRIVVACGGTSDIYVAEEAALTAEMLGNDVVRLYDVGVAGLHRLMSHAEELSEACAVIAVAGMEGALPSVIAGLVSCPVIAVPTSVGYGASLNGLAALLAMLNSCASGVSVVNIDNGFGAGYQASLINH